MLPEERIEKLLAPSKISDAEARERGGRLDPSHTMEGTNIFSNNRGSSSIRIDLHKVTKRAGVGDYKTHQKPRRSNLTGC
jgi:hypothetical protein